MKTRGTLKAECPVFLTVGAVLTVPQELVSLGRTLWGHMPQFLVAVLFSDPLAPVARRISICMQCPGTVEQVSDAHRPLGLGSGPHCRHGPRLAPRDRAPLLARGPLGLSRVTQRGALSSCPQVI